MSTTATWTYEHFTTAVGFSGGQSLHLRASDPGPSSNVSGSVTFGYSPAKFIDFQVGARESWQIVPNATIGSPPPQWVIFAGIGLHAPPFKF
jgi:hypothetical protein